MCAKAISHNEVYRPKLYTVAEPLTSDDPISTLGEFGTALGELTGTSVSVLTEGHIRIPTPEVIDEEEIRSLREFISNSLYLPVNIFREEKYIEIMAI